MKANVIRPPKSFSDLNPLEKQRINNYVEEVVFQEKKEISSKVQRMMIKYWCCILHDSGVSNDDILMYLGNFRRYQRKMVSLDNNEKMEDYLDGRLKEMFGGEFPEKYVKELTESEQ